MHASYSIIGMGWFLLLVMSQKLFLTSLKKGNLILSRMLLSFFLVLFLGKVNGNFMCLLPNNDQFFHSFAATLVYFVMV
jgi:hypothetical protein